MLVYQRVPYYSIILILYCISVYWEKSIQMWQETFLEPNFQIIIVGGETAAAQLRPRPSRIFKTGEDFNLKNCPLHILLGKL